MTITSYVLPTTQDLLLVASYSLLPTDGDYYYYVYDVATLANTRYTSAANPT